MPLAVLLGLDDAPSLPTDVVDAADPTVGSGPDPILMSDSVVPTPWVPSGEKTPADPTLVGRQDPAHGPADTTLVGRRDPAQAFAALARARADVAELHGYGPIAPAVARAIALGGTWTRLVTDPASGTVHDVGRTRYKPPPELADLVRARDRTCTRPGCSTPAHACDIDHTVAYHLGGSTASWNLGTLCPADHALKSAGILRIRRAGQGTFDVTTPTGYVYRRHADGTTTRTPPYRTLPDRTVPPGGQGPAAGMTSTEPADEPPPF